MRLPAFIGLMIGAWLGAMIGAMFDNILTPGPVTVAGAGAGMLVAALVLLRLQCCDPLGLFRRH